MLMVEISATSLICAFYTLAIRTGVLSFNDMQYFHKYKFLSSNYDMHLDVGVVPKIE